MSQYLREVRWDCYKKRKIASRYGERKDRGSFVRRFYPRKHKSVDVEDLMRQYDEKNVNAFRDMIAIGFYRNDVDLVMRLKPESRVGDFTPLVTFHVLVTLIKNGRLEECRRILDVIRDEDSAFSLFMTNAVLLDFEALCSAEIRSTLVGIRDAFEKRYIIDRLEQYRNLGEFDYCGALVHVSFGSLYRYRLGQVFRRLMKDEGGSYG